MTQRVSVSVVVVIAVGAVATSLRSSGTEKNTRISSRPVRQPRVGVKAIAIPDTIVAINAADNEVQNGISQIDSHTGVAKVIQPNNDGPGIQNLRRIKDRVLYLGGADPANPAAETLLMHVLGSDTKGAFGSDAVVGPDGHSVVEPIWVAHGNARPIRGPRYESATSTTRASTGPLRPVPMYPNSRGLAMEPSSWCCRSRRSPTTRRRRPRQARLTTIDVATSAKTDVHNVAIMGTIDEMAPTTLADGQVVIIANSGSLADVGGGFSAEVGNLVAIDPATGASTILVEHARGLRSPSVDASGQATLYTDASGVEWIDANGKTGHVTSADYWNAAW